MIPPDATAEARPSAALKSGPQVVVVSFCNDIGPFSPRAERTRILAAALEEGFGCTVHQVSDAHRVPAGLRMFKPVLLDPWEPLAMWQLSRWTPTGSGALLIGSPVSPLYYASKRLVRHGIPYVVDVGDPWGLTFKNPESRVRHWRRTRAESFLWRNAAGGIVTTAPQAAALRQLFPHLPFLCRPNGYQEVKLPPEVGDPPASNESSDELRLVHFGNMYWARLALPEWLSRLRRVAGLRRVQLTNFGDAFHQSFQSQDSHVAIELRKPVKWSEACRLARGFDGAIVVGNKNPAQLPSKAIQYLTLPIPRLAVTMKRTGDALADFAAAKPGFVAVDAHSDDDALAAVAHLRRSWSTEELEPPASDAWSQVAPEIIRFALDCWNVRDPSRQPSSVR